LSEHILHPGRELCVYVSFFWAEGSSNDPGLQLFYDYLDAHEAHLQWFVEDVTERPRRFALREAKGFCEGHVRGHTRFEDSSGLGFGAYGGRDKKGVSPWAVQTRFQRRTLGSRLFAAWPLAAAPPWTDVSARLERFADASLLLAHAGLTYSYSVFEGKHAAARHAIVPRFWGIDPPEPIGDAFAAVEGVRSPSWLTYVPTSKLHRLAPGALESLPPEIVQTRLPHGTLFRLGPEPILGDQNRGEPMPLHRALARALRPIRGELTHWTNSTSYKYPTWVARFDDPADEEGGG
jgi:hypothetical protein